MFKFAKTFTVAAFAGLAAATGLAQPVQFDWTTTNVGYSAEITLDAPSSTHGGLGDIVSASITTPDFGTIDYTPATGYLNGSRIVWSSTELTELSLDWSIGPVFNQENPEIDAGPQSGLILNFNSGAPDPFFFDIDQSGSWVAVPVTSVTDTSNTLILFSLALATLAAARRFKPLLA